jgi:FAD/FMN-containing dehydrogenase
MAATQWRNWLGNQTFRPMDILRPHTEPELQAVLALAARQGLPIRPVGAGHSFSPVVETPGLLIDTTGLEGIIWMHPERLRVRVRAGTSIRALAAVLNEAGLALANQGDIDAQSVAGALATATHGAGLALPCLSAQALAFRLLTPMGTAMEIGTSDPDLLAAARVSLGLLGVVTEIELAVVPAHDLRLVWWSCGLDEAARRAGEWVGRYRHMTLYWLPRAGSADLFGLPTPSRADHDCLVRVLQPAEEPLHPAGPILAETLGRSHRLFPAEYEPNFREIEHAMGAQESLAALTEAVALFRRHPEQPFPIEIRYVRGDDAWLSPFRNAENATVSISADPQTEHGTFLNAAETLLKRFGGRPHWGKIHCLSRAEAERLYPDLPRFRALQRELDPGGRLLSPALRDIFE